MAKACDLTDMPGVGAKKAALLQGLGCGSLSELRAADADDLYMQARLSEGKGLDKCVSCLFRCAVAYSNDLHPNPGEYRWWFFCDEGKGLSV